MDKISHFLLSKSVEDLILRSHLGLRSNSGSSGLSLTSGPICLRRSQRPCLTIASLGSAAEVFPRWWPSFCRLDAGENPSSMVLMTCLNKRSGDFPRLQSISRVSPLSPETSLTLENKGQNLVPSNTSAPISKDFSVVEYLGQLLQSRLLTTV